MGVDGPAARRQRERHRLHGRLHAPGRANKRAHARRAHGRREGSAAARRSASASARCAASARRRSRRCSRRARRAGRSRISSTSPRASTPSASTRACSRRSSQCGAFDTTLAARGISRAHGVRVDRDRASSEAARASRDRERGQTNCSACFDAGPRRRGAAGGAPRPAGTSDRRGRGTGARCSSASSKALGFYVSGHPLERYLKGGGALSKLEAVPTTSLAGDGRLGGRAASCGMVEGYRERIFKDGGGKVAFFDLEDLTGRVTVKVRGERRSRRTRACSRAASPCSSREGELPVPRRRRRGGRRGAARADALPQRGGAPLRLGQEGHEAGRRSASAPSARPSSTSRRWPRCSRSSNGNCPVTLVLAMKDGAEAFLSLGKEFRVEVSDEVLSGLEQHLRRAGRRAALSRACRRTRMCDGCGAGSARPYRAAARVATECGTRDKRDRPWYA